MEFVAKRDAIRTIMQLPADAGRKDAARAVREMDALEQAPRMTGTWRKASPTYVEWRSEPFWTGWECSVCSRQFGEEENPVGWSFCPHCGAQMSFPAVPGRKTPG